MHHQHVTAYRNFCELVTLRPDADNLECIRYVMAKTGHKADPNIVAEWWGMWQIMRGRIRGIGAAP